MQIYWGPMGYFKLQRHGSIGGRRAAEPIVRKLRPAWDVPTNTRVYSWQSLTQRDENTVSLVKLTTQSATVVGTLINVRFPPCA